MRNCAARLTNFDNPTGTFRVVSPTLSRRCTDCVSSPQYFTPIWLEQSRCFQLGTECWTCGGWKRMVTCGSVTKCLRPQSLRCQLRGRLLLRIGLREKIVGAILYWGFVLPVWPILKILPGPFCVVFPTWSPLGSSKSGQQSKKNCTYCASSPKGQFRESSAPIEWR